MNVGVALFENWEGRALGSFILATRCSADGKQSKTPKGALSQGVSRLPCRLQPTGA
jgi:hypothetical protein